MIEFKKCPVINGTAYGTLKEAHAAVIIGLAENHPVPSQSPEDVANWIVEHELEIVDALTTTERSKPSARKINGGTKKRKGTVTPPAQTP